MAAGDHERVEIGHARGSCCDVGRDGRFAALAAERRAGRRSHEHDAGARAAQRLERTGELAILELLLDEQRDALA